MDCDRGDNYCRTLGTQNRCYFSAAGSKGQGVLLDPSNCTSNAQCQVSYCAPLNVPGSSESVPGRYPRYCTSNADCSRHRRRHLPERPVQGIGGSGDRPERQDLHQRLGLRQRLLPPLRQ